MTSPDNTTVDLAIDAVDRMRRLEDERDELLAALARERERYDRLVHESPGLCVITRNVDGIPIIDRCNTRFEDALGVTRGSVLGRPLTDYYTPESRRRLLSGGYRDALDDRFVEAERELLAPDGRVIPTLLIATPEIDSAGHVTGTRATFLDISERQQAERELRESEERYRQAVHNSPNPIFSISRARRILTWNTSCERVFQYTRDVIGQTYHHLLCDPAFRDRLEQLIDYVFDNRTVSDVEMSYRSRDGTCRFMTSRLYPLVNPEGVVDVCVIANTDLTERKQAEVESATRLALFTALIENMVSGVLVETDRREIFAVNTAFCRIFAIAAPPDALLGADCAGATEAAKDVVVEPDQFPRRIEALIAGRRAVLGEEIRFVDGRTIERDYLPIVARDGRFVGHLWQYRDVTERRALEAQLRQAQKMEAVGELTGGIAHDFNNLLTVIQTNLDLIAQELPQGMARLDAEVRDVRDAAQRGAVLINKLLAFSRQGSLVRRELDVRVVISELAVTLRRVLPESIDITYASDEAVPMIVADAGSIEQILINLATNARDAMPNGGEFRLEARCIEWEDADCQRRGWGRPGRYVCVVARDTGCGMEPDVVPRIFEPFFTTKPTGAGTGLGMAMVYGLIKQQGGFVDVESEVGVGTVIRVLFPAT